MMNYHEKDRRLQLARAQFPQGLPLSHLKDELVMPGPDEDPNKPTIAQLPKLLNAKRVKNYIQATHDDFNWDDHNHRLPIECFAEFTTDEKIRVIHNNIFMSELGEEMENNVEFNHFNKLRLAFWHWGSTKSYAHFVEAYNSIRSFDFGMEGFETYLDHSTSCNERGYANFHRNVYLDAELGFMIYHQGEHVLTIGFSPSKVGVLLAQVQCATPKGNRWLFKLKTTLLEHVVNRFKIAFPGKDLYLINGQSLAEYTRNNYQSYAPELTPSEEVLQAFAKSYRVPIPGMRRTKTYNRRGVFFKKLHPTRRTQKLQRT